VAFGGQADQVSAALKERYSDDMSLSEAFAAALAALSAPGNGERTEFAAAQLEVAILDRARDHRTFRRIRGARLEELLAEARPAPAVEAPDAEIPAGETPSADPSGSAPSGSAPSGTAPGSSGTAPGSSTPPSSTGPSSPGSPPDTEPPTGPAPGGSDRGTGLGGGSPL
jgi:proteasome alpha subunit